MYRFLNNETGKFLVSSSPCTPKPFPYKNYIFSWSKNGHFYRNIDMVKRTAKRLKKENIDFTLIKYDESFIGTSKVIEMIDND